MLVVPQFTLSIFGLVWLTTALGWSAGAAGGVMAAAQSIGALGRIVAGTVSDRAGSRVRVLRWVAVSGVAVVLLLAAAGALHWGVAAAVMLIVATAVGYPVAFAVVALTPLASLGLIPGRDQHWTP